MRLNCPGDYVGYHIPCAHSYRTQTVLAVCGFGNNENIWQCNKGDISAAFLENDAVFIINVILCELQRNGKIVTKRSKIRS